MNIARLVTIGAVGLICSTGILTAANGAVSTSGSTSDATQARPSHIAGIVTSGDAGADLRGVAVTQVRDGVPVQRAVTNKEGKFVFAELKPGVYTIVAEKRGVGAGKATGIAKPGELVKVAIQLKKKP